MKIITNQSGFNLVQLLIATTIFTVVSLGIMNLIIYYSKVEQQQRLSSGIVSARYQLISFLQDERGWLNTIYAPHNDTLYSDCLTGDTNGTTDCFPASAPIGLAVYNSSPYPGELYYEGLANEGFSRDGEVCDTFDAINGNFNCPFHAEVQWRAICPGSPCYQPTIEVDVKFSISQSEGEKKLMFNPENYNFTFQK